MTTEMEVAIGDASVARDHSAADSCVSSQWHHTPEAIADAEKSTQAGRIAVTTAIVASAPTVIIQTASPRMIIASTGPDGMAHLSQSSSA